jgi:hypothetical protein
MTALMISMEQMIALHSFFAEAVALGESAMAEILGAETEVDVLEVRCTALGDFGDSGLQLSDDMVAAVMGRIEGAMPGSINLVADPEEALSWSTNGGADDPVATFVALGDALLSGVVAGLSEVMESPAEFCDPGLVEEAELAMLVKTHAPSDTLVISTRLRIEVRDEIITAHSHLLVEPKYLTRLLSALSAASH